MFADPSSFPVLPVAVAAGLALLLGLAQVHRPVAAHRLPGVAAFGIPVITGHLAFNGMNHVFPPSAGIDWLPFGTIAWLAATGLLPAGIRSASDPGHRAVRIRTAAILVSLTLAGIVLFLCQARLPWLFSVEETASGRGLVAAGVVAGGIAFCAGEMWLASLVPPAGFWLSQLALTVPIAMHAGLQPGPGWISAIHWLLPAVAAGALGPSIASRRPGISPAVAIWCGVVAVFPFLWSAVSRVPAADPRIPLLLALIPGTVAALLAMVRSRLHPVGLSLIAAACMLAGASAIVGVSPMDQDEAAVLQPGDDSGAYD